MIKIQTVVIPTPDASKLIENADYEAFYLPNFHQPKSLIRFSSYIEDVIGCDYNVNEEQLEWIKAQGVNEDEFEQIIVVLEAVGDYKVSGECPTEDEAREAMTENNVFPSTEALFSLIYEYWKDQRYVINKGERIKPILKVFILM